MKSLATNFGRIAVKTPPAPPGIRIGVMGGSFNPPHIGHVTVAKTAVRRLRLNTVWWLVTPGNPLKPKDGLPSQADRMAKAEALCQDNRMVMASFEETLNSPFTAETLAFLKRRHGGAQFVWVMGADNLASFHRWQNWRDIAQAMPFAVVDRPGWRFPALSSPAARALARYRVPEARAPLVPGHRAPCWTFLSTRLCPLSSTELRRDTG
ncbi:MAG: nicotinate-nucleotide adenylyltransferase [Pseudomonadota bacterium]